MFSKFMRIVFLLLLPFGAMACTRKPTPAPTSSVSYETAMEAITELSDKMKDGEARLTELEKGTDSSVLERLTTMEATVKKIEEFRTENPGHFGRVTDTTFVDRLKFECEGSVPGFGQRDLFELGSKTLFCTQPGIVRPQDGSACFNIPGTLFWDCGFGQILRECVYCGCGTETATPDTETATPDTKTATPDTKTATPDTKTATPTTQPIPTNGPEPEGTKECECLDVKIDFGYKLVLGEDPNPTQFGTIVEDRDGAGFIRPLPGQNDSFMETSWDDCQWFVGNMYRLDKDWGNPGQGPVTECVVVYHRGMGTVKINASDGIMFHVDEATAGFTINVGIAHMRDTLLRGGYGCTEANIKYIELKSFN